MAQLEIDEDTTIQDGPCFLCGNQTDADESYCFGCKQLICEDCDNGRTSGFGHDPAEHAAEIWEDDEEQL